MYYINGDSWIPADDISLEDSALDAVKHTGNVSVIAGPGAGKTELLAQKAGYLFETGNCKPPYKILAISFKVDAAKNLDERVKQRYGKRNSLRFESKTFDSFAKGLLDQFISSIPYEYRPNNDYDIVLSNRDINEIIKSYLKETNVYYPDWQYEYSSTVFNKKLTELKLPIEPIETDLYSWLIHRSWNLLVKGNKYVNSSLTFPMISILVDYLLENNPLIVKSLQSTYTHIFLDEFQDTTYIQYKLLKTIFSNSNASITAVGDKKQRIMGWAGALKDAFADFKTDFDSYEYILINNFRSAPRLVEIQNLFSQTISRSPSTVKSIGDWKEDDGVCQVWVSDTHIHEGEEIAASIKKWMDKDNLNPRDIALIVKQHDHVYAKSVMESLEILGIHSRLEKEYQDLLSDEWIEIVISIIELSLSNRSPNLWINTIEWLIDIKSKDNFQNDFSLVNELEDGLSTLVINISENLQKIDVDNIKVELTKIVEEIMEFVGLDNLKAFYPKYKQVSFLEKNINEVIEKLSLSFKKHKDLKLSLKDFSGEFSIPIMTVHKSKGLEYNTVIFIGLEDSAFWNYSKQSESEKKAFFVALSRAKERIIFTFSKSREILKYRKLTNAQQSIDNISDFYKLLNDANVPVIDISNQQVK